MNLGSIWSSENLMKRKVEWKKYEGKNGREKASSFPSFGLIKNTRIWMRNLNVNELLKSCWYHLSSTRLEEVGNSFTNFSQTFLIILWGKFYHLFLTIFLPNFSSYFLFVMFSKPNTRKKVIFLGLFPPNFLKSKRSLSDCPSWKSELFFFFFW